MAACKLLCTFLGLLGLVHLTISYTPANETRRNAIPVFYARGTTYEVGYSVGKSLKSMILEHVNSVSELHETLLPKYNTDEGKKVYELTLEVVQDAYPQYLEELRGVSDGSGVPLHWLLLMHFDGMVSNNVNAEETISHPSGCSSILCNQKGQMLIGHNEDSFKASLNHIYILHADIEEETESGRKTVESFSSVCYAGELPGFTMGYNKHGVIYTINVVEPKVNPIGKMPRQFVTRELLAAKDLADMKRILQKAGGPGMGDGLGVNVGFWKRGGPTSKNLYNIEAGPVSEPETSAVDVLPIKMGETLLHTNRFLRLKIEDKNSSVWESSEHRENRYKQLPQFQRMPSPC